MTFDTIGSPKQYTTSTYLIPISAKLHGFGEITSEEFYKYGMCYTNKDVVTNGNN